MNGPMKNESGSKVKILDDSQAAEFFDKQVRSLLGISAEEFLQRRANAEYSDVCDNSKVLKLLMINPMKSGCS